MNDTSTFAVPPGHRQFFLDDHGVAQVEHLSRTMHQPTKKGTVIRPNVDRGESVSQTRSAPARDPEAGVTLSSRTGYEFSPPEARAFGPARRDPDEYPLDPGQNVEVMLRTAKKEISVYNLACEKTTVRAASSDGPYRKFVLPTVPGWQMLFLVG